MLSEALSEYICGLKYSDLPEDAAAMAKVAVLDWLGSVLGGSLEEPARMTAAVVREEGGDPQATAIGFDEKTSVTRAALVNGVSCHILELDDLHKSSIMHPAAPIISAAAAMAESRGLSGKEFITGVVAGYEVGIRIAEAITPSHYHYWHTTGTCGTFGAAAAAANIAGLGKEETVNALGNAGSQAAGLWEFLRDGAMTKHLHPGKAAMNGILAVLLARRGFTGAKRILEGEKGYFRAAAATAYPEKATRGLGVEYRILGNSYKIYPSCRHTHGAVDLALKLAEEGLKPDSIEKITVWTYGIARDLVQNPDPTTPFEAKFSLPFCVAGALIHKRLVLDSFTAGELKNPDIRQLMSRCTVEEDPEIDALYPAKWPCRLEVTLKDGRLLKEKSEYPKGDPENPASLEELKQKFKMLASRRWDQDRVDRAGKRVDELEKVEDISILFSV